jgi:hypothetical protein
MTAPSVEEVLNYTENFVFLLRRCPEAALCNNCRTRAAKLEAMLDAYRFGPHTATTQT